MADQTEADRDLIDPDDYWVWDPNGKNDLDSMVGGMMVLIDADDLRELASSQRAAYDRGLYVGRRISPTMSEAGRGLQELAFYGLAAGFFSVIIIVLVIWG